MEMAGSNTLLARRHVFLNVSKNIYLATKAVETT
jgi:hypothetical protein